MLSRGTHSEWRIRRGCAAVLGYVDDAESLQRLVLLTRDPKKKVRKMAALRESPQRRASTARHPTSKFVML